MLLCLLTSFSAHTRAEPSILVTNVNTLRFGTMAVITPGTLTIHPQTNVTSGTAWVVHPPSLANQVGAAEFTITCVSDQPITYTLELVSPASGNLLVSNDVSDFVVHSSLPGNPALSEERTVNQCLGYIEAVKVGATLTLSNPSPGTYQVPDNIALQASISNN